MNPRIRAVIRKEFRDYRRHRFILLTMLILPVAFVAIPVGAMLSLPDDIPSSAARFIAAQFTLIFLIVPVALPTTISAHSIIGERNQRSLEPLLSTPLSDRELLWGKALAAGAPAVAAAWGIFGLFLLFVSLGAPPAVAERMTAPGPAAAVLGAVPVIAALAVVVSLLISERSSDVRVAQQLAAFSTLPVIGLAALFTFGVIDFTPFSVMVVAAAVVILDVLGWRLLTRLFNRERLLTRGG